MRECRFEFEVKQQKKEVDSGFIGMCLDLLDNTITDNDLKIIQKNLFFGLANGPENLGTHPH